MRSFVNSNIRFRFADKADSTKIYDFAMRAISESILPRFAQDAGEDLNERITNGDPNNVAIAEDHDEVVAYIEIDPKRSTQKKVIYIRGIFVLGGYRRQGIGNKLLKMMREEKCKNGEELYVDAFTPQGVKFWKALGFEIDHYVVKYKE